MIGRCESQTGDFGVFMRPLTAGSLLGVPNLSSANTTTAGKKSHVVCFFLPQSSNHGYFWLSCATVSCSLTHVCQRTHAKGAPVTLRQSFTWSSLRLKRLTSSFAWNEVNAQYFFYLSLTELFQLLSQSRQDRPQERRGLPENVECSDLWYFINLY